MLLELSSDKFLTFGEKRKKIVFKKGLNIVTGDDNKSNSIGKSTFLMIIDFCFGGKDYIDKGKDIVANIGHHVINFAFNFEGEIYYFSRNTSTPNIVNVCDKSYRILEGRDLDIKSFTSLLKSMYKLEINLSFRDIISKYFRVYGRDVTKESKPLAVGNEAEDKSVKRLLKLYNYDFSQMERKVDTEVEKKNIFRKSINSGIQEKIGKREYDKNNKLIEQKQNEILELSENFIGSHEAEQIANLKLELSQLKRQKNKIEMEKTITIENRNQLYFDEEEAIKFFPNIDVKKISQIENFHKNITDILKSEIDEEIKQKQSVLNDINNQIKKIEDRLSQFSSFKDISRKQLIFVQEAQQLVDELESKNKIYVQEVELKESSVRAIDDLNDMLEKPIEEISNRINQSLKNYNSIIFHSKDRISPKINFKLNKMKKWMYDFKTENDTGTGAAFKSMILLDLTILKETVLPAVAHDSFLFTDIENSTVCEIVKIYNQFSKQIFVALTDKVSYGDPEAVSIIKEKEVLYLSANGNELFGKSWKTERKK